MDLHIGASPEVPGGLQTAPAEDEEDIALDRPIIVATKSSTGKILIGTVNPIVNGKQIYVRRIKATLKIIVIINCGNWTRQLGGDFTFKCDTRPGACIPGDTVSDTSEDISTDGKTRTVIVTTSDGCTTKIEKTVTTTVENRVEVCKPGSLDPTPLVNISGNVKKSFKVSEAIKQFTTEQQSEIISKIGQEKINGLIIFQGACEEERGSLAVYWFAKKGGGWNWLSFIVGAGVGFAFGYWIKGSPDNPVLQTPTKTINIPTIRTGATGNGNNTSTGITTRPRKP